MNLTLKEPDTTTILGKPYNVILFNDDNHDMMEVVDQIIKATRCDAGKATAVMMEAHRNGKAIAYTGGKEKCELVESILNEIQLGTKIEQA